jgi:hypothetical protein
VNKDEILKEVKEAGLNGKVIVDKIAGSILIIE